MPRSFTGRVIPHPQKLSYWLFEQRAWMLCSGRRELDRTDFTLAHKSAERWKPTHPGVRIKNSPPKWNQNFEKIKKAMALIPRSSRDFAA